MSPKQQRAYDKGRADAITLLSLGLSNYLMHQIIKHLQIETVFDIKGFKEDEDGLTPLSQFYAHGFWERVEEKHPNLSKNLFQ